MGWESESGLERRVGMHGSFSPNWEQGKELSLRHFCFQRERERETVENQNQRLPASISFSPPLMAAKRGRRGGICMATFKWSPLLSWLLNRGKTTWKQFVPGLKNGEEEEATKAAT